MRLIKNPWLFILMVILGLCTLIVSILDIIYDQNIILITFSAYLIILILVILIIYFELQKKQITSLSIEEFEKRLEGGLIHFKCSICNGIFAIKKSKRNNKKYVQMTCPDCGELGVIPPNPVTIEEIIPEKKSTKANFSCNVCGEGITVWAEGTDLYSDLSVYSCPFCGKNEPLKRF